MRHELTSYSQSTYHTKSRNYVIESNLAEYKSHRVYTAETELILLGLLSVEVLLDH